MNIVFRQNVFCDSDEANVDNIIILEKSVESNIIPRIGESIYNYIWKDDTETKVADVIYDFEQNKCDVSLEKRNTDIDKERVKEIAVLHKWTVVI